MSPFATESTRLPRPAPARVLALGAFLKNRACLLVGDDVVWSPLHGDLGTPAACAALAGSAEALLQVAAARCGSGTGSGDGPIDAIAHDLHPDFFSTRMALEMAARLGVPALAVQHHHAHLAVVQAEQGWGSAPDAPPVVGLALDGVGLGSDHTAWGGEVLCVRGAAFTRIAHLPPLALPGGDIAAREPWRLVAAVLHAAGRGEEIGPLLAPSVGSALARGVATMLARDLNCPRTTSAGRWFDAAAGALGLSTRQAEEAEAAQALEAAATTWLDAGGPARLQALRQTMQRKTLYKNLVEDIISELRIGLENCLEIGIKSDNIILDPGIGFAKTAEQNLEILQRLREFKVFHRPVLIGTSRKSFIGQILNQLPGDRLFGSVASNVVAITNGANILRVHDVYAMSQAALVTDAILNKKLF